MQPADCYKILGVPFGASITEVTAAYKKLSEKFQPDANAGDPFFREKLKEVQEAYHTIANLTGTEASRQTAAPFIPIRKKNGKAIGGAIFGILLIAVVIFKYTGETKKISDTEKTLTSMGLLPKDSGNTGKSAGSEPGNTGSSTTPAGLDNTGSAHSISIIRDEIFILGMMDAANERLQVYPSFTISNAKNVSCHAVLYLYDEQGNHLKTENQSEYANADGTILASLDFTPQEDQVKYSSSHSDLVLSIPYSKLYLSPGTHRVQYEFLLYDNNWKVLEKSERLSFNIEQN